MHVAIPTTPGPFPWDDFIARDDEDRRELVDGELAIEMVSPSSVKFDRVKKLAWYASIGVPEYWIVDAEHRTCERLVLAGARYTIAERARGRRDFRALQLRGPRDPARRSVARGRRARRRVTTPLGIPGLLPLVAPSRSR